MEQNVEANTTPITLSSERIDREEIEAIWQVLQLDHKRGMLRIEDREKKISIEGSYGKG